MIAVINDSGAILYDLSEREADTYAGRIGFLSKETWDIEYLVWALLFVMLI